MNTLVIYKVFIRGYNIGDYVQTNVAIIPEINYCKYLGNVLLKHKKCIFTIKLFNNIANTYILDSYNDTKGIVIEKGKDRYTLNTLIDPVIDKQFGKEERYLLKGGNPEDLYEFKHKQIRDQIEREYGKLKGLKDFDKHQIIMDNIDKLYNQLDNLKNDLY